MNTQRPTYHGHRFPPQIISHAICESACNFDLFGRAIVTPAGGVKVQLPEWVRQSTVWSVLEADWGSNRTPFYILSVQLGREWVETLRYTGSYDLDCTISALYCKALPHGCACRKVAK